MVKKLHLGCGNKHIDGFVNIDIRRLEAVDEINDINKLTGYTNNSIDLIYACHVLEHTKRREYKETLKKWYSILKPEGILRISVPDFEKVVEHYIKFRNLNLLRGFLWGGQDYDYNFHYIGWDFDTLRNDLIEVGFIDVSRYDWRKTDYCNMDDYSQSYLPHMDKENGMLMSLNVEAKK